MSAAPSSWSSCHAEKTSFQGEKMRRRRLCAAPFMLEKQPSREKTRLTGVISVRDRIERVLRAYWESRDPHSTLFTFQTQTVYIAFWSSEGLSVILMLAKLNER